MYGTQVSTINAHGGIGVRGISYEKLINTNAVNTKIGPPRTPRPQAPFSNEKRNIPLPQYKFVLS
jgi:hypothetical protein